MTAQGEISRRGGITNNNKSRRAQDSLSNVPDEMGGGFPGSWDRGQVVSSEEKGEGGVLYFPKYALYLILIPSGLTNLAPIIPTPLAPAGASCLVLAFRSQIGSSAKASRGPQIERAEREREGER